MQLFSSLNNHKLVSSELIRLSSMLKKLKDIKQKVRVRRGDVFAAELLLALRLFDQRSLVAQYDTLTSH